MSEDFSQDQNRKTLRSFYCRDYLWELFEQMTRELGCSMDYLINESMRQYARSRDYSPGQGPDRPDSSGQPQASPGGPNHKTGHGQSGEMAIGQNPEHRTFEQVPAVGNSGGSGGGQQSPNQGPGGSPGGGPPPPPSPGSNSGPSQQNRGGGGQGQNWNQQPTARRNQGVGGGPQQGGGRQQGGSPQQASRRTLFLLFNNNRYPIDQERFIIGRGSQNTDLTIRDGNISRQHCAIIHRNNNWYLKDLDSTNGIEFRGNRIESKRIEEGDVFYLCDYPLQFTYN